jgi:drug/metabolite transporter (DMT)-like permease
MAFCIGPFLQFTGLSMAQSVDNALMVALEPLVTVLLAWVILGERLKLKDWISLCFGLFGFLLLSKALVFGNGNQPYSGVMGGLSLGYILLFLSLTGEGVYSSLGRKLSFDYPATAIFGNLLLIGTCAMTVVIAIRGFHVFEGWSPKSIFAILWLGPVSTLGGYLLWMLILSKKEIAGMVVTLFIQPLVGALIGVFYLGETISLLQIFGALLIMSGVLVEAFFDFKQKRAIS